MEQTYDVVIIGGGINGCGCAADAALRGLKVLLFDKDALASKTSANSSKLIHGGLRYLEYGDWRLVRKALKERQRLFRLAPHLVQPLPIVLPHGPLSRPMWLLRTGLYVYDHLSCDNSVPRARRLGRRDDVDYFQPLQQKIHQGFLYYDGITDDVRLTLANAQQASLHGANILPFTALESAEIRDTKWQLTLKSAATAPFVIEAKCLINATGPWIEGVTQFLHLPANKTPLALVKGSHILVHQLYPGEHAYLLQNHDKRVIFTIPYQGQTLIGTTEKSTFSPDDLTISPEEVQYLLDAVNFYFKKPVHHRDIIKTWCGIRPLISDPNRESTALSRDYAFQFLPTPAPNITIFGGKITTYRQLAEEVIDALKAVFPQLPASQTADVQLP